MARIVSAVQWLAIGIYVILWLPVITIVFLVTAPFDPGRYHAGFWFRRAGAFTVAFIPQWRFRTSGVRIRDPRRPYVVVANHESYADIFLISQLRWEMKWLSKDGIFRIPVMGWMMRMAGDIEVYRGNAASRAQSLAAIRRRLDQKVSVMVMPEGTRSRSGELLPFQSGAFRAAIEKQVPVLPIAVAGTRGCMQPGTLRFTPARAEARVLPPIETAGMTLADVDELKERVRALIAATRAELQRELGRA
ncbi:MAG: 1-acyl-sn-glycerol-3-phosphate acyltransferase [Gemmatimonadetes bacterium]|nr:1-acyl-sn-glycerol-3-phosphate acyltransferase [Gemmatimonadota bacterium]